MRDGSGSGFGRGLGRGLMVAVVVAFAFGAGARTQAREGQGLIARTELLRFLDGKPGMFLQRVTPEAQFVKGRFYGWKLASFFPGDSRFASVDVKAGDIVLRINGSSVERPEQLVDLWQALRRAKELVVDIDRDGAGRRLRWAISD